MRVVTINQCGEIRQYVMVEGALLSLDDLLTLMSQYQIRPPSLQPS